MATIRLNGLLNGRVGRCACACLLFIMSWGLAFAERVNIRGGGGVVGPVKVAGGSKQYVIVTVSPDLLLAVPKARVSSVTPSEKLREYEQRTKAIASDDSEAQFELAKWCKRNGLREQNRYHLQRVVAIDPNHRLARAALGYRQDNGRWVEFAKQQRNFGLINTGGNRWEVPEIVAREKAREEYDKKSKLWKKELKRMINATKRDVNQALQDLQAITDPMASDAVAEQLESARGQPRNLRMIWIKLLGSFRTTSAVKALVKAGLEEPDLRIRNAALEQLQHFGASSAVATYNKILVDAANQKHQNESQVRAAAIALQAFADPEDALIYVDALVTEHPQPQAASPGMSFGFGDTGANGMSAGGQAQVQVIVKQNNEVRNLLKLIEKNVDYAFDELAWRRHFAGLRSRFNGDLRRDL